MRKNKFVKGFIDPLSLVAIAFLILTVGVGTAITTNTNVSMNINKFARSIIDIEQKEEKGGYFCSSDKLDSTKSTYCKYGCTPSASGGTCKEGAIDVKTPTPTPTVTQNPGTYCNVSLISTSGCGVGGCLPTQVQQTWKNVACETVTKCVDNSDCKADPVVGSYCSPEKLKTTVCKFGCTPTTSGGECKEKPIDVKTPTPTKSPTPTPTTTTTSALSICQKDACMSQCGVSGKVGACENEKCVCSTSPSPIGKTTKPTCTTEGKTTTDGALCCSGLSKTGCVQQAGHTFCTCKAKIINGRVCTSDDECQSGHCYQTGGEYWDRVLIGGPGTELDFGSVRTCHEESKSDIEKLAKIQAVENLKSITDRVSPNLQGPILDPITQISKTGQAMYEGMNACLIDPNSPQCYINILAMTTGQPEFLVGMDSFIKSSSLYAKSANLYLNGVVENSFSWADDIHFGPGVSGVDDVTSIVDDVANKIINPTVNTPNNLTLYHGSQKDLTSILDNGLYGYEKLPTLSDKITGAPILYAYSTEANGNLGGYILEVKVPPNLVVSNEYSHPVLGRYSSLSKENAFLSGGLPDLGQYVSLSPKYISNIFPVTPDGMLGPAIPSSQWSSFATEIDFNIEQAAINLKQNLNP